MSNSRDSLDSEFIQKLIDSGKKANVFLSNGVKLEGTLTKEDENCFLLSNRENKEDSQLVYKNMVATIKPL